MATETVMEVGTGEGDARHGDPPLAGKMERKVILGLQTSPVEGFGNRGRGVAVVELEDAGGYRRKEAEMIMWVEG